MLGVDLLPACRELVNKINPENNVSSQKTLIKTEIARKIVGVAMNLIPEWPTSKQPSYANKIHSRHISRPTPTQKNNRATKQEAAPMRPAA
jgi:hypothetical protein